MQITTDLFSTHLTFQYTVYVRQLMDICCAPRLSSQTRILTFINIYRHQDLKIIIHVCFIL